MTVNTITTVSDRLEKKTEDNKELLKALTALLSNAHSALSSAPEGIIVVDFFYLYLE